MQIHSRNTEEQGRWLWTEGLQTIGQSEIALRVDWPEDDPREVHVTRFLRSLESYLTGPQPHRIVAGQELDYGWSSLRFVLDEQNVSGCGTETLLIEESTTGKEKDYQPGVARSLALLQLQNDALKRNRIASDGLYPRGSQSAIVCSHVTPTSIASLHPLRMERPWQSDEQQSGWFIGCGDPTHNHKDARELASVHLSLIVEECPMLFPYLAMPIGTMVIFEEKRTLVYPPEALEGQADPAERLTKLP